MLKIKCEIILKHMYAFVSVLDWVCAFKCRYLWRLEALDPPGTGATGTAW